MGSGNLLRDCGMASKDKVFDTSDFLMSGLDAAKDADKSVSYSVKYVATKPHLNFEKFHYFPPQPAFVPIKSDDLKPGTPLDKAIEHYEHLASIALSEGRQSEYEALSQQIVKLEWERAQYIALQQAAYTSYIQPFYAKEFADEKHKLELAAAVEKLSKLSEKHESAYREDWLLDKQREEWAVEMAIRELGEMEERQV